MDLATRWSNLFVGMSPASFFNFSFLPKYGVYFLQALGYTLLLAVISVLLAVIPALLLAFMRLSKNKFVRGISGAYIAIFRSTPLLVQLSIIYFGFFGAISIPRLYIFGFIDISRFIPGVVALALNSSAYVAEIFRAGILAVDAGQTEAARSLGLSATQAMKLVVLPQAIKNVLPALGNEVVTMVKESSICSTLGMVELRRGNAEVEQDAVRAREALARQHLVQLAEVRLAQANPVAHRREADFGVCERLVVAVDAEQGAPARQAGSQMEGMPRAAQRGVDVNAVRPDGELLQALLQQNTHMVKGFHQKPSSSIADSMRASSISSL